MESSRTPAAAQVSAPVVVRPPLQWTRVGGPEVRADGSTIERFVTADGSSRETLRIPTPAPSVLLFSASSMRAWQGSALPPSREREVHAQFKTLLIRDQMRVTRYREDADGTITEMPLTSDPILGPPRHRIIVRFPVAGHPENPEWTRLHVSLSTPL